MTNQVENHNRVLAYIKQRMLEASEELNQTHDIEGKVKEEMHTRTLAIAKKCLEEDKDDQSIVGLIEKMLNLLLDIPSKQDDLSLFDEEHVDKLLELAYRSGTMAKTLLMMHRNPVHAAMIAMRKAAAPRK